MSGRPSRRPLVYAAGPARPALFCIAIPTGGARFQALSFPSEMPPSNGPRWPVKPSHERRPARKNALKPLWACAMRDGDGDP